MKKLYFLSIGIFALSVSASAQSGLKTQSDVSKNLFTDREISFEAQSGTRATQFCSDTNLWAWGRSIDASGPTYFTAFLHTEPNVPKSYGTYVDVPAGTTINVTGFGLYARSLRPDGAPVTVTAAIYAAGADPLPTGTALQTVTLALDTTSQLNLSFWEQQAIFSMPAVVNKPFVITIESSSTPGDSIEIIRGYTGSGVADNFPAVYQADGIAGGAYFSDKGGAFGARLPHFYPYVSFNQTSTFGMSVSQLSGPNENVNLTYTGYSIKDHPVWSISGFIMEPTTYYSIDGGSNFSVSSTGDTTITFVDETVNYTVVMNDSIIMWTNPTCVIAETITLLAAAPNGIEDAFNTSFNAYFANNRLTVENGLGTATLYSITGRMVKQMEITNNVQSFDVSELNEGVYILQVGDNVTKLKL